MGEMLKEVIVFPNKKILRLDEYCEETNFTQ